MEIEDRLESLILRVGEKVWIHPNKYQVIFISIYMYGFGVPLSVQSCSIHRLDTFSEIRTRYKPLKP